MNVYFDNLYNCIEYYGQGYRVFYLFLAWVLLLEPVSMDS